jgi:kinesin family protein 5
MSGAVGDMKLQLERVVYESKEASITTDALREQNADLVGELEELKVRPHVHTRDRY